MWQEAALFLVLTLLAYQDYREKKVNLFILLISGAAGTLAQAIAGQYTAGNLIAGIGVGAAVCLFSEVTRGKIGMGDGLVIVLCGIFLGFERNIMLCMAAIYLAGAAALLLFLMKKRGRNYRMPFVPFLWASYVVNLLWNM